MSIQKLIEEIVDNFYKQQQLYLQIADLSRAQLDLLEHEQWLDKSDILNDLLEKRQNINQEIDVRNNHVRLLTFP